MARIDIDNPPSGIRNCPDGYVVAYITRSGWKEARELVNSTTQRAYFMHLEDMGRTFGEPLIFPAFIERKTGARGVCYLANDAERSELAEERDAQRRAAYANDRQGWGIASW